MIRNSEYQVLSEELVSMNSAACIGAFFGGILGGFMNSRRSHLNFMENNTWTQYDTHLDAKRHLQSNMTLAFGKGCFRWAWRTALFCYLFVYVLSLKYDESMSMRVNNIVKFISGGITISSAYRGDYGVTEYIVSGVVSGALYKCNLGLRGMVSGGLYDPSSQQAELYDLLQCAIIFYFCFIRFLWWTVRGCRWFNFRDDT